MLAASIVMVVIRAPHGQRSRSVKVASSRKGWLEITLLVFAWIGFFVPLVWIVSPAFSFAEYPLRLVPLVAGIACFAGGLWLFHQSHADLGTNWSITLEVREQHQLIAHGVYSRIRHPMYAALLLYGIGQTLALPNWVAGPSYLVVMTVLVALRLGAEEQMMLDRFGEDYAAYMGVTKRLVPGVW
ncbi:MAG TPA: protein-S-isoprenylcysteine O-methyltransferase [Candidatus Polarisedimenticolia bacterium]|nr:protein-S-isoprenylcysteine O-methyltransferase [Candidatus Polarisedimenticolia bacterium]